MPSHLSTSIQCDCGPQGIAYALVDEWLVWVKCVVAFGKATEGDVPDGQGAKCVDGNSILQPAKVELGHGAIRLEAACRSHNSKARVQCLGKGPLLALLRRNAAHTIIVPVAHLQQVPARSEEVLPQVLPAVTSYCILHLL